MDEYNPDEDIFFEVMKGKDNGKTVVIYLSRGKDGKFIQECKCYAEYYLEQLFNNDNQITSEIIKENPYCIYNT